MFNQFKDEIFNHIMINSFMIHSIIYLEQYQMSLCMNLIFTIRIPLIIKRINQESSFKVVYLTGFVLKKHQLDQSAIFPLEIK